MLVLPNKMCFMEIRKSNKQTKNIMQFNISATIRMLMSSFIIVVNGYFDGNCIGMQTLVFITLTLPRLYFYLALSLMNSIGESVITRIAIRNRD